MTAAKPDLGGGTYAEIFESLLAAGQKFMEVWQGADKSKEEHKLIREGAVEAEGGSEREGDSKTAEGNSDGDQGDAKEDAMIPEPDEPPQLYSLI